MASFSVDAEGNRIKTDILVAGYMREAGDECKLLIPNDINKVCFEYWLISICDEWDKELSSDNVKYDEQTFTKQSNYGFASIYGCLGIDKGSHIWQIKVKSDVKFLAIGIIQDDEQILNEYKHGCKYVIDNGCCLEVTQGKFYHGTTSAERALVYCQDKLTPLQGTIFTMTLDMDTHTLSYKINDKDYGVATDKLDKSKYRLVVTLFYSDPTTIELL